MRLLFLQLYKSTEPSVRPDEELAYLAITRPEVNDIVEPVPDTVKAGRITLDTIPDAASLSDSLTQVDPSSPSPPSLLGDDDVDNDKVITESPLVSPTQSTFGRSVLGKRASQDREASPNEGGDDRSRLKSEGFGQVDEVDPMSDSPALQSVDNGASGPGSDDFELIQRPENPSSPSAVTDLADLRLRSEAPDGSSRVPTPDRELDDAISDSDEGDALALGGVLERPATIEQPIYDPPSVPPPLPLRPVARRASTLASGLKFGLQQDSAEVLINVLSQLELAFDPAVAEGEGEVVKRNFISE